MSYIGQGLQQGKAERFIFTASGSETSVTLDDAGRGIAYTPGQVDVYLNGVKLVNGTDFTATSGSSITGLSALSASDVVEIVALDAFSPADTVSAASGGTFNGNVTVNANLTSTGTTALQNLSTTNSALNISSSASDGSATIDASGNLLVGKTVTSSSTVGSTLYASGAANHVRDGGSVLTLNRTTSDGDIQTFLKDGTTIGTIGTYSGYPYIANNLSDGVAVFNNHFAPSTETGAVNDGTMDLGSSTRRFKNLYLSGGVYLGGTGAANYLDDYETGTWTPLIYGSGTAGSYSTVYTAGYYVKVGDLVWVTFHFHGLSGTGSGYLRLSGLPFTISAMESGGIMQANSGLVFTSGYLPTWMNAGGTTLSGRATSPTGSAYHDVAYPVNPAYVRGNLCYKTV